MLERLKMHTPDLAEEVCVYAKLRKETTLLSKSPILQNEKLLRAAVTYKFKISTK